MIGFHYSQWKICSNDLIDQLIDQYKWNLFNSCFQQFIYSGKNVPISKLTKQLRDYIGFFCHLYKV